MSAQAMRKKLKKFIKEENERLRFITKLIKEETPGIKNYRYLRLLSKASYHRQKIDDYRDLYKHVRRRNAVKKAMVTASSKVKLVSTRIGAIVWVDARNYVDLLGKQIGDVVLMHNSTFQIAGIY